jgi:hypothetical protein
MVSRPADEKIAQTGVSPLTDKQRAQTLSVKRHVL